LTRADDYAPGPWRTFGHPPVDVGELMIPTADYEVIALAQDQRRPPDGRVIPDIDVSFRIPGLPGVFVIRMDNYGFEHGDPIARMLERVALIRTLYALEA
jgi:hypothetical protein